MKKKLIFFVWISNKHWKDWELLEAFSAETNSGKLLNKLEYCLESCEIYKTNLFNWVPLDEKWKIRYHNNEEKLEWLNELQEKIRNLNPDLIILFWKQVYDFVLKYCLLDKKKLLFAYHPSYISVYKRNMQEEYINDLLEKIKK